MHERLRHFLLGLSARIVSDHPVWTLLIAGLITAAAIAVTVSHLRFEPDRNALVSQDLDWNQRYVNYLATFRGNDDLVVVVRVPDGADGRTRAEQYIQRLAENLEAQSQDIASVHWGFDSNRESPAAIRMLPWVQFNERITRIEQHAPTLDAATVGQLLSRMSGRMAAGDGSDDPAAKGAKDIDRMGAALDRLSDAFETDAVESGLFDALILGDGDGWQYLPSEDGQLLLMAIATKPVVGRMDAYTEAVATIRRAQALTDQQVPGVESGLTGVPVIEADETAVSMRDSMKCSILAVLAIATLLIIAFHSFRWPLLAVLALLMGVAWSFGFLTISIGHLQILSVVFTVILLGLGIDFGIHIISRFELVRHRYPDGVPGFRSAMVDTMQTAGPGIITGAITTALAFGTTLLTRFKGMAEMGLIAGVGILLCLLAMCTVFPALMRSFRRKWKHVKPIQDRPVDLFPVERLMPFARHPGRVIGAAVLVIAAAAAGITQLQYDYDLENLLPRNVDSVKWQDVYRQHSRRSVLFGASICRSLEDAQRRTAEFRKLDSVDSVQGVGMLFPEDEPRKLQRIEQVRARLAEQGGRSEGVALASHDTFAEFEEQIRQVHVLLAAALVQPNVMMDAALRESVVTLNERVARLRRAMDGLDQQTGQQRLDAINREYQAWREQMQQRIAGALDTRPLELDDLPAVVRRDVVARDPQGDPLYLLKIFSKGNVYEPAMLEPFMQEMRSVDDKLGNVRDPVTGTVVQIYESARLIRRSYVLAGIFALLAVTILVYLDFQYLVDALLCLVPVCTAFVTLLGLMGGMVWWLGPDSAAGYLFSLNPANIIVLPLLFGIGVDAGVHMIHRYRVSPRARPPGLTSGTGKGIILTSLTTIIGFSSLMLASHRGIASLGFVLTFGTVLTLLACLTLMPAVLVLRWRLRAQYPGIFGRRRRRGRAATG